MDRLPLDSTRWPFAALAASLAMLAAAHGFERFMHLAPCVLCYNQRQVYWAAAALSIVAIFLTRRGPTSRLLFTFNLLLGVAFLVSMCVAGYHSLVEWGIAPAPDTCAAGLGAPIGDDLAAQLGRPIAVPSCAEPLWDLFGITMANFNTVISLGLAAATFYSAYHPVRPDTANELPGEAAAE